MAVEDVTEQLPSDTAVESQLPLPVTQAPEGSLADTAAIALTKSLDFDELPYHVLPPGPPISTKTPVGLPSQLTAHLEAIKAQNEGHFKPSRRLRGLEVEERGCWLFETVEWPKSAQYDFWSSLYEHVKGGSLGWGVFVCREQVPGNGSTGLGQVRLYCWGEIVEEICLRSRRINRGAGERLRRAHSHMSPMALSTWTRAPTHGNPRFLWSASSGLQKELCRNGS